MRIIDAYIGVGSNLRNPAKQVKSGIDAIGGLQGVRALRASSLYTSVPMGPDDQPDYVNAVVGVRTSLVPLTLLKMLQKIESQHGRIRIGERWGPRTLDLDLLLYGNDCVDTPELTVPHVGMAERSFVLYPLSEIAPDIVIPKKGSLGELLAQCPVNGLRRMDV